MALVKTSIQPTVVNVTNYNPSGNIFCFSPCTGKISFIVCKMQTK